MEELDQNQFSSSIFPFHECLNVLDKAGKHLFGKHFQIYPEDHEVIFKLLVYFLRDRENALRHNISFGKGILLAGAIGAGKTSLMGLMRYISAAHTHHIMLPCRQVAFEFHKEGFQTIQKYSDWSFMNRNGQREPKIYCFDDLGAEQIIKYYGNDTNVMTEILLSRYDLFVAEGMRTHLTTNLTSSQIEEMYGARVRSRLRSMVNLITYTHTYDRRS